MFPSCIKARTYSLWYTIKIKPLIENHNGRHFVDIVLYS